MIYTNGDLLDWNPGTPRTDELYVVTETPWVIKSSAATKTTIVRINLNTNAAVLDSQVDAYPGQPTLSQIRTGQESGWLLSGGTLISDHRRYIAVGLRDGNAADRFMYTNVGAGRCDRRLFEHCCEERDSEFILCVKDRGIWRQVIFGPDTLPLDQLNKPDVSSLLSPLLSKLRTSLPPPAVNQLIATGLAGDLIVKWYDAGGTSLTEQLSGYVFIDHAVHTTEFRLAIQYDLSAYDDERIFFGEGTGYAEWMSLGQIRLLARAGDLAGRDFLTSFLRHL